ncbi:hypothetical protein DFH28DRAFT_901594 [Melampsora americana]|nr:hypothetical protein DFH28DRAFT_901594 [Melampsora americana]
MPRHTRSQALKGSTANPSTVTNSCASKRKLTTSSNQRRPTRHRVSGSHEAENMEDNDARQDEYETEDDEDNEDELLDRQARQTTSDDENSNTRVSNSTSSKHPAETAHLEESDTLLPTIKEYKNLLNEWPLGRIAEVDRSQKKKATVVPPHILTEARAIQKIYKHQKAMLTIMGNISMFTLQKALGELGGRRQGGRYQIFLKYSKERRNHRMPAGKGHKGILAARNRKLGKIWTAMPLERQKVFEPSVFYTLSGLVHRLGDDDDESDVEKVELEPEELAKLQGFYDELVCQDKVAKEYAKVAAGKGGPTLPDYNRKSLKCIERIHSDIENEANNMEFSYYLLACSTHASTDSSSGKPGWAREFTSHNEMAAYVNKKSNFARVFAAHAQGLSVAEVVAQTVGANFMSNSRKVRKTDPGDIVKADLALLLRGSFSALLGKEQGFPRGPDPVSLLRKDHGINIIQLPGSKLPSEVLKLGFNGMNSRRSLWLEDVKANKFKLEKMEADSESLKETANGSDSATEDEVMMTQDFKNDQQNHNFVMGLDEDSEESEDEWNGLGDFNDNGDEDE